MPDACRFLLTSLLFLSTGVLSSLSAGLDDQGEFQSARQAMRDGLPAVAAVKATRLLDERHWDTTERLTLASLAVEAWVRAKNGQAALAILEREPVPNSNFWQAQASVLAGDSAAAEQLLQNRLQAGEATSQEKLLLAQISIAQNNPSLAREVLSPLVSSADTDTAHKAQLMLSELDLRLGSQSPLHFSSTDERTDRTIAHYLQARSLVEMGQFDEAQVQLRAILGSSSGGERVHHSSAILLADSMLRQEKVAEAADALVQFLDNTAESEVWNEAFDLLAKALQSGQPTLVPPDATLRWITEGNTAQRQALIPLAATHVFQGHAMLLLSRWMLTKGRLMESLGLVEAMIQVQPDHPQANEAMRLALEGYGSLKADGRVTVLADLWRKRFGAGGSSLVDFVTGSTAYTRNDFKKAAELFQTASNVATTLTERRASLYNACVAALRAGEVVLYQSLFGQLQVVSAGSEGGIKSGDSAADLEINRALDLASRAQSEAKSALLDFIEKHPQHPRLADAQLALAEVALNQTPVDFGSAKSALDSASGQPGLSDAMKQRLMITRLWMLDRQGDLKGVTELGTEFVETWPNSHHLASVRMKVADAFFRLGSFASARTEFELVAKEHANSPYADSALYFAGMASMSINTEESRDAAISLLQELAERGGPLSIAARQQQALAKRLAGQEAEALKLVDSLLTEKNLNEDMRRSLTCEKAEMLLALGEADAKHLIEAVEVLREMRREDDLSYLWNARAGYTLARVLKTTGNTQEALEACYDVVQANGFTGPSNPSEYRWYYRAGFFGIELLEASKQWEAAARLAEKLAQSNGERANDAKELATKIRLDHFLWDAK